MRHPLTILVLLTALLGAALARADWIEQSNRYALEVLNARSELQPEYASSFGLDQFDADVSELGPDISQRWIALNEKLVEGLLGNLATEKDPRVRQDLQIMIDALRADIASEQIESRHFLPYYNLHELMFRSFRSLLDPRNDRERYPAALQRLSKYAGRAAGHPPITQQAVARTTERLGEEALLGPYRGELETDLDNAARYVEGIAGLFEQAGLQGWQEDLALLQEQLEEYRSWLQETLLPRARTDPRLPAEVYANNLKEYGVTLSPAELIERGQYSYQLLRSEMKSLALRIADRRGWEKNDLLSVMHALKREQVPPDELLPLYQSRLQAVEAIIRREQLVTLPQRPAVIRLATEAEAAATPASFMSPPQLINNTGQYGEFVLVQTNPALGPDAVMDDWSHEAITWALTVHEARPGHELQFATLVENRTSLARANFAFNSANVEGWGLYAESIMQEFLPLEGQLFNLFLRIMRAARMFLDPMVNTGRMSRDEAEQFLVEQLALSRAMASSEADRYAFRMPGQATAYYVGYINLMRLRTEVELALGEAFDQRAFHDYILEQGLLPPQMLREAVLEHFVP